MTRHISCHARLADEAGFTLIELLIATTLVAFLSLLLFGGLRLGTRVWEKTETSTTSTNRVRMAQLYLIDEITRIYPFYAGTQASDKHVDFSGEERKLTFFSPSKSLPGSLDLVTIQALPDKGGVSLVVASKDELTPAGREAHHTLIGGLKWLQISYFGPPSPAGSIPTHPPVTNKAGLGANAAANPGPPPQWTSVWEGQRRLPLLIRIRAAFKDRTQWPDLVLSPRTNIDETCVLDQLTKYCQGR